MEKGGNMTRERLTWSGSSYEDAGVSQDMASGRTACRQMLSNAGSSNDCSGNCGTECSKCGGSSNGNPGGKKVEDGETMS